MYQISERRLRSIKTKLINGLNISDKRGLHVKYETNSNVWQLLHEFLDQIPSQTSHYMSTKVDKKYFIDTDLNLRSLYNSFIGWFYEKNNENLKLSLSVFSQYFRKYCNYGFRPLRIDLCDFCLEYEKSVNKLSKSVEYKNHKIKVNEFKIIKKSLISDKNCFCIEFDYNSNKVLPKMNNCERYYKRALYLYLANIHIHTKNYSFIFHSLEGEAKKGANSVASYLYYVLKYLSFYTNLDSINMLCFLSDAPRVKTGIGL